MERIIKNLELKKSGNYCFYLCASIRKYGDVWDLKNTLHCSLSTSISSVSSWLPNSIFFVSFLAFAVNFGSSLSGLGVLKINPSPFSDLDPLYMGLGESPRTRQRKYRVVTGYHSGRRAKGNQAINTTESADRK